MTLQDIPRRVHFVGIGGIGMSGMAQYLHKTGYCITGSDRLRNDRTDELAKLGIKIYIGHNADNIGNAELVVRTSAVHDDNVEIREAEQRKIPVILREQMLGAIFNGFNTRIAVCGTHGKTTVTAMIHEILSECGVSHSAFIGGVYHGNNYYFGRGVVVAEACEYNRSFLNLNPTICVCVNAEYDHPDCYANEQDVYDAFERFVSNTDQSGYVVLPSKLSFFNTDVKRAYYDDRLVTVRFADGKPTFDATIGGDTINIKLNVVGAHNVNNALAAITVANILRLPANKVLRALARFDGVDRRWTERQGICRVVCDYAHHPTEIECSVSTARSVTDGKVVCLFQPHTYSRTQAFFDRFAECFRLADKVIYLPVYSAREQPVDGVNSARLADRAVKLGVNASYADSFEEAYKQALSSVTADDLLLILGAGDIVDIAEMFCRT